MAPGPFQLMRKHWKKSAFILTAANTSLWYAYDYTVTNDIMKSCCRRAALKGDERIKNFDDQPRHITVILNPVAGKRKSKKLYAKWVEPLLHLAGIKVSLVETHSPNQAYDLMKIMSNCDAVAIVGGDGTVHEALNGLLHRPDASKAVRDFPIAIMPTGQYNSIARYLHQSFSYRNQKEFLIQATDRLINSVTQKHDVLKITPLEADEIEPPIYALRDVRYGKYQDNFVKVSGWLFYQTKIRPLWLRLKRAFSSKFPNPQIESISYTKPCIGCSKCYEKHRIQDTKLNMVEEKSANRRWWSVFAPVSRINSEPTDEEKKEMELVKTDNPDCDHEISLGDTSDITDFRACMMGSKKVRLSLASLGEYTPSEVFETQTVKLKLGSHLDDEKKLASQKSLEEQSSAGEDEPKDSNEKDKENGDDKTIKFLIDGQATQAHSIEISTLSKAVTIFTGARQIIP